jgi:hypothetical protein
VLLDGAFGHHELVSDRPVRAPLRHQVEHVLLPLRQLVERTVAR